MKNIKFRRIFGWLFKYLVTVTILYYLFQHIPVSRVVASLSDAKVIYILSALFLQISIRYINALQLKIFSHQQGMTFTVFQLTKINFITQFYGLFLPGELSSGLVKWHKLSRENKMRAQAVTCIVLTRAIHMLSLAFFRNCILFN